MKQAIRTKRSTELTKLRAEVAVLRSFVIGVVGRDSEGSYRPDFVHQILQASNEAPIAYFESPEQFSELLETIEE